MTAYPIAPEQLVRRDGALIDTANNIAYIEPKSVAPPVTEITTRIELTTTEYTEAAKAGFDRHMQSIKSTERNRVKNPNFKLQVDVDAACAERAFAKALGIAWNRNVGTYQRENAGLYRCKYTSISNGRLVVRRDDAEDGIYVLLVGSGLTYEIKGAITGAQARQIGEQAAPNGGEPAWFVSQKQLKPISEL